MFARWFYISTSRLDEIDTEECIREIVNVSIPRNRSLEVTGALLFTGRNFVQYLEGTPTAIEELKASILQDPRHENVRTIASGEYSHRRFVTWSLAYAGPSQFVANIVDRASEDALQGSGEQIEALAQLLAEFSIRGRS
ncbi:BLUF domain-containing protein [Sphingobium sp. TB-6]|uniref:BLUF domain-containing protein n=1 Tax=Sphingobium sp. TB-6 TaxID=2728850 RepID=UPI00146CE1DD|nr:BLUF domain-containing protein [Sphingobium sp. TB-6]NML91279.1 BLUF domain-containing protein [Sphingobium sp. TB-6]